jgi:hypothetical protein
VWLKFGLVSSIDGTDAYAIAEEVSNFLGAELTGERDWSEVLARRHPRPPA